MGAEHMSPEGLRQGYFCMRCGRTTNMYATGHETCERNPERVRELIALNRVGEPKPQPIAYQRCLRVRANQLGKHEKHEAHIHFEAGSARKCTGRFN